VAVDLNNSGGRSVLNAGFVEWNNLVFDGGDVGPGISRFEKANEITAPKDLVELTYEEYVKTQTSKCEGAQPVPPACQ
jgi:hypothetical protein